MPNIAQVLKEEIARLSRREIRRQVQPLRGASTAHRRHIAALKRQVAKLERQVVVLGRRAAAAPSEAPSDAPRTRFVAKGLVSLRRRLGLSAGDLGRLLGVTGQSIYNWEAKKATPRAAQLAALAALRGVGKREVKRRLEALAAASGQAAEKSRKPRKPRKVSKARKPAKPG
jgi:DNA-binding transcriptional regulator YiaG